MLALAKPPHSGAVAVVRQLRRLSADKQSYRCADQNQKSRKGRHNAYLFKDGP
jgi:hypothetical protein